MSFANLSIMLSDSISSLYNLDKAEVSGAGESKVGKLKDGGSVKAGSYTNFISVMKGLKG